MTEETLNQLVVSLMVVIPALAFILRNQARAQQIIQNQYLKFSSELETERKERAKTDLAYAEERGSLKQQIETAQSELRRVQEAQADATRKDAGKTAIIEELQRQIASLQAEQAKLREEFAAVKAERDRMATQLKDREQLLGVTQRREQVLIAEIKSLQRTATEKESELSVVRMDMLRQNEEMSGLRNTIEQKNRELEALRQEIGTGELDALQSTENTE